MDSQQYTDAATAIAMSQHRRVGEHSGLSLMGPELLTMILKNIEYSPESALEALAQKTHREYQIETRRFGRYDVFVEAHGQQVLRIKSRRIPNTSGRSLTCEIRFLPGTDYLLVLWGNVDAEKYSKGFSERRINELYESIMTNLQTFCTPQEAFQTIVSHFLAEDARRQHPTWRVLYDTIDNVAIIDNPSKKQAGIFTLKLKDSGQIECAMHPLKLDVACFSEVLVNKMIKNLETFLDADLFQVLIDSNIIEWIEAHCPGWHVDRRGVPGEERFLIYTSHLYTAKPVVVASIGVRNQTIEFVSDHVPRDGRLVMAFASDINTRLQHEIMDLYEVIEAAQIAEEKLHSPIEGRTPWIDLATMWRAMYNYGRSTVLRIQHQPE